MKLPEMTRRNKTLLLLALIIIAVPSIFIYNYTQNDPRFCTSCHLMNEAYDTWTVSAMHDLTCHECHETDMIESVGHVVEVLTKSPEEVTKPTEIDNSVCERCHASNDPKWLQVENTAGHNVHIYGAADHVDCIDCHGLSLHVFEPPEATCVQCHGEEISNVEEIMGTHCVVCHEFTAVDHDIFPEDNVCLQCHEEQSLKSLSFPVNAHNDTACINCHNPHEEEPFPDCTSCHVEGGGLHAEPSHVECTSCHVPHSDVGIRETCESCHVDKVDHYAPANCATCHSFTG
jgi:nitrate/TMAO reductase-like tetraheme cytochrome c subunit